MNSNQIKEKIKAKLNEIEGFYNNYKLELNSPNNILLEISDNKFNDKDPGISKLLKVANSFMIRAPKKNVVKMTFILDVEGVKNLQS